MNDTVDLLQIKIEGKKELPTETINAINAVDWRKLSCAPNEEGLHLRAISDLELETELLLCGL